MSCVIHHLLLLLLPLILLVAGGSGVHCIGVGERKAFSLDELRRRSGTPLPQTSRTKNSAAVILELRHRLYTKPLSSEEDRLEMILFSDEARISSLHTRIKGKAASWRKKNNEEEGSTSDVRIPLTSGAKLQTLNYIATIEMGSTKMTVIVDTGSELTWVQCKPCTSCYNQQDPLFDPSTSPTYQPIPCNSPTCYSGCARNNNYLQQPGCSYAVSYGDGSYTRGVLAREQINLGGMLVDGFVFGCGQSNRGLFGGTSGLMGLGHTDLSLVSQTVSQFGGVFSYCLPAKQFDSSGSLILGNSTFTNSAPVAYTRMIPDPATPFYFLNLTGMRVGGVALRASGLGSKVLIDSGTVISRLVPSVYEAVRSEFLKQFSEYPPAPGFSILDTCFDLSSKSVEVPEVKLEFEGGVEVEVDVSGVLYFVKSDASQVCLALAQLPYEDQVGILGNYQQKNLRVIYDTKGSKLGFAQETCGYI